MHPEIRQFPSANFYSNKLKDGPNIQHMKNLHLYSTNDMRLGPYCIIDCLHGKKKNLHWCACQL